MVYGVPIVYNAMVHGVCCLMYGVMMYVEAYTTIYHLYLLS